MTQRPKTRKATGKPLGVKAVRILEKVEKEARKFLTAGQFNHILDLAGRLTDFGNPAVTSDLRIDKVENCLWELKDKGGSLGKTNVRIFFTHHKGSGHIIVVGVVKKEAESQIPSHIKSRMRNRARRVRESMEETEEAARRPR